MKTKNQRRILGLSLSALLSLNVLTAKAEQASSSIQIYAGLEPVMTFECTAINFGVYQVARGDRGISEPTRASLSKANASSQAAIAFTKGNNNKIALSNKPEYGQPQAGTCTVRSSQVRNGSLYITRDPVDSTAMAFSEGSNPFASGLALAKTKANGIEGYATVPTTVTTNSDGDGVFTIVGELDIPNNLTADNYGSYKAPALTITVSETQP